MILITSDLHWNDNPRDVYRHQYVDTIVREIKKNKVSQILILGDLTDEKNMHDAWLVNAVFQHIHRLAQLCTVFILRGNHDYTSPSYPFFKSLGLLSGVRWINEPTASEITLFLPHTNDYKKDWEKLEIKTYKLVFTHNTFEGALAEHGKELGGIPRTVFSKKQTVISGDVHVPQKLGVITYVGSPYPINHGDSPDKHMILLDDDNRISYIPYDGPQRVMLDIPSLDTPMEIRGLKKGDMVKVRVRISGGELGRFQKFKEDITVQLTEIGCIVSLVQPIVVHGDPVRLGKKVHKKTDEEILEAYSFATGVRESIKRTGVRLMRKV